jgi:hypothetical protein
MRQKRLDEYSVKLVNSSNTKVLEENPRVPGTHKKPTFIINNRLPNFVILMLQLGNVNYKLIQDAFV